MAGRVSIISNEISKFEFSKSKYSALPIVFESSSSAFSNMSSAVVPSVTPSRNNQGISSRNIYTHSSKCPPLSSSVNMCSYLDTMIEEEEDSGNTQKDWVYPEDDHRSSSPSGSIKSGHSSPSEVGGDSGVGSEHDTPPLSSRKPLCTIRRQLSTGTDSDEDSNISSESLHEITESTTNLSGQLKNFKHPDHRHKRNSKIIRYEKKIPDNLLKELKEKYKEFKRRRQHLRGSDQRGTERCSLSRANSYQRSGKLSRIHSPITTSSTSSIHQDFSTLSLADSSNFSSTTSLFTEDDESIFFSDCRMPLYEFKDEAASHGFAGLSDIFAPQQESTIRSSKGTIRGVKNRVRAGIATFTSDQRFLKLYAEREKGKVVVYTTTLGIVRETYERCLRMRKILWTLLIHFEERDVFMSRDTQIQLLDRLHARTVSVPHVFLEGQYLGGVEFLERLNETGELRRLLQPYTRPACSTPCDTCGGYRLLPCSVCRGSKKSVHRNDFTLEFVALKCSSCDESGLVGCHECNPC